MKAVADYIHEKGFKFGMYSCCGTRTCADYPGSLEHEYEDAKQFAAWGVDYLKYDNCFKPSIWTTESLPQNGTGSGKLRQGYCLLRLPVGNRIRP